MKNLIIIGAGGFGREVYNLAKRCNGYNTDFLIKGFLDDKIDALSEFNYPAKVISSVEDYKPEKDDVFVCALGDVRWKMKCSNIILNKGGEFFSLIHPSTTVMDNVNLGKGLIIMPNVLISNDSTVGDFVTIQAFTAIGHDCKIGDWCQLNSYSFLGGFCELENGVTLNPQSVLLPKLKVGENAIVGAGSVVIKNVKPKTTVFGNPAKVLNF